MFRNAASFGRMTRRVAELGFRTTIRRTKRMKPLMNTQPEVLSATRSVHRAPKRKKRIPRINTKGRKHEKESEQREKNLFFR